MEEKVVSCVVLLAQDNKADIKLLYRLILQMIHFFSEDGELDEDEFSLLVEEAAGNRPVSLNYAKELVQESGAFVYENGTWKFNSALDLGYGEISWEQFIALFRKEKRVSQNNNGQMDQEKSAIIHGIEWCVNMVELAKAEEMKGVPAFLRCGERDSLIGKNVAGTATSDALSLLCNGIDYIKECNIAPDVLAGCYVFLAEQILKCQYREGGWDQGGFFPLEDQPEAEHPTVDATCLAVMALCDFYTNREAVEEKLHISVGVGNAAIEDAVLEGVEFLFRMQQPEGSFGIYKYEQEHLDGNRLNLDCSTGLAEPNDNCTRMVLSTMGVSKGSGIFDARERFELYEKCSESILKAYQYLQNHMAQENGVIVWAPYFGTQIRNYPCEDIIVSSARVCRSLIPVWRQCEKERGQIRKYYLDFFAFWKQEDKRIKGKIGKYMFKTPGKDKYSAGVYIWQSYPEMIAAFTVLQGYNLFGLALNKEEWLFLETVVCDVLEMQHPHGHWNAPHTSNPFCAVTLAAIELLKEYRTAKGLE